MAEVSSLYKDLQLDNQYRPITSKMSTRPEYVSGMDFESTYEVQARSIRASNVDLSNFISIEPEGEAIGTLPASGGLILTTSVAYEGNSTGLPMHAKFHIGVYLGTSAVGSMQLFPIIGAGVPTQVAGTATTQRFVCQGFRDWNLWDGTADSNSVYVKDMAGTGGSAVLFKVAVSYLRYANRGS